MGANWEPNMPSNGRELQNAKAEGFQMPDDLAETLRESSCAGPWLAKISNTATVLAVLGGS